MVTPRFSSVACLLAVSLGCGGGGSGDDAPDAGGPEPASTAHCAYEAVPATAGAGGTVTPGAVEVGLADRPLDLPVGTALGGNTSRARVLDDQGNADGRDVPLSGGFNPSVGVETIPRAKAIAIRAGGETVVIVRTDTIFSDDTITFEVQDRLGAELAGKVIWASSHTHTAPEQYTADSKLQVGGGRKRRLVRDRLIDAIVETAQAALADLQPARIGIAVDTGFDPDDRVSFDRRPENDDLHDGQARKDDVLAVIRVDSPDGVTRAVLPVFGVHSAILDDDVALFSTDVSGMYERLIEEQFDHEVMAIHLQGAAGDVLASYERHVEFRPDELRMDFAMSEANARRFLPQFLPVFEAAGDDLRGELALEMVTRSIPVGPDWRTLTIRDGALAYAPWDGVTLPDGEIFAADGSVLSPVDEFNAPYGAALCGDDDDVQFLAAQLPGATGPYYSCSSIPVAIDVLGALIDLPFEEPPLCSTTRTTVSALRLGDYVVATGPGEPLVPWADLIRARSPVAPDKTIVLGYAQGHVGYLLTADDWLRGGFEPTINAWGPLEGEYIAEQVVELMGLVMTPAREDAAAGGVDRVGEPTIDDPDVPAADPAPMAGAVPAQVPATLWTRSGVVPASAQPDPTIPRVAGMARLVWIGEDPLVGTPRVTLEREVDGAFAPVTRRSGRVVDDLDLIVTWTPDPLVYDPPRTHYWAVEWQAVTWLGAAEPGVTGDLEDRAGVPLGRYRFRVDGSGYTLHSDPFDVVPGALAVTAAAAGGDLALTLAYVAEQPNWRLLVAEGSSNRPVPVARGPVTVELTLAGGGTAMIEDVAVTAAGQATVTPPKGAQVSQVRVIDRFGNVGATTVTR